MRLRNKVGQTPLHCAAAAGCWASATALHNYDPRLASVADKRDLTAQAVAAKRGHTVRPTHLSQYI